MKHNKKITAILIGMFLLTQIIGFLVFTTYSNGVHLPYGMEPPEEIQEKPQGLQIIIAFAFAIFLFILLMKIKAETFIRIWFFVVTTIALGLAVNAILLKFNINYYPQFISLIIALPLTYLKIFKRDIIIHNLTELLIYPGIAAVFIPLLNLTWTIIILLLISLYDIWAVWHSEFMQKMAKFQINNLKFFTGFFVPYASLKQKMKIKEIRQKYSNNSGELEKQFKKAKIKINLAILGGGDIVFPVITSGVIYRSYSSIYPALTISLTSTIALLFLFMIARKGKFYPAMPFITIGIYLGMIINWIIF